MKRVLFVFFLSILLWSCSTAEKSPTTGVAITLDKQVLSASCGQCQFGLAGSGCDLAVKIGNRAFYVDGTSIDDHGDAHGDRGFCNAIRQAEVSGSLVEGRFQSTSFVLVD